MRVLSKVLFIIGLMLMMIGIDIEEVQNEGICE